MNKEIKEKWVNALRSGDYHQTAGMLRRKGDEFLDFTTPDSFCCLGVLCDLYCKSERDRWLPPDEPGFPAFGIQEQDDTGLPPCIDKTELPSCVMQWADLDCSNPRIECEMEVRTLADLNDSGRSFKEIADLIEQQL